MTPFYVTICEEMQVPVDQELVKTMEKANNEALQKVEEKIADAEQNLGETEVNDGLLAKAEHFAEIGDKEKALEHYKVVQARAITTGTRIDIQFALMRVGFFFFDNNIVRINIEKARTLIEEGGDWDRRNRLKAYEGAYLMSIRDFKGAAGLFLDTLSTFTSTELMEYKDFVKYAVLTSLISLQRVEIKKRVRTFEAII